MKKKVNKIYNFPNNPAPCFYEPKYNYVLPHLSKTCKNLQYYHLDVNYGKHPSPKGKRFELYKQIKIKKYL